MLQAIQNAGEQFIYLHKSVCGLSMGQSSVDLCPIVLKFLFTLVCLY